MNTKKGKIMESTYYTFDEITLKSSKLDHNIEDMRNKIRINAYLNESNNTTKFSLTFHSQNQRQEVIVYLAPKDIWFIEHALEELNIDNEKENK